MYFSLFLPSLPLPVVVVLKNGPSTPLIQPKKFAMPAHYRVSQIMDVLREKLQLPPEESLVSALR